MLSKFTGALYCVFVIDGILREFSSVRYWYVNVFVVLVIVLEIFDDDCEIAAGIACYFFIAVFLLYEINGAVCKLAGLYYEPIKTSLCYGISGNYFLC